MCNGSSILFSRTHILFVFISVGVCRNNLPSTIPNCDTKLFQSYTCRNNLPRAIPKCNTKLSQSQTYNLNQLTVIGVTAHQGHLKVITKRLLHRRFKVNFQAKVTHLQILQWHYIYSLWLHQLIYLGLALKYVEYA